MRQTRSITAKSQIAPLAEVESGSEAEGALPEVVVVADLPAVAAEAPVELVAPELRDTAASRNMAALHVHGMVPIPLLTEDNLADWLLAVKAHAANMGKAHVLTAPAAGAAEHTLLDDSHVKTLLLSSTQGADRLMVDESATTAEAIWELKRDRIGNPDQFLTRCMDSLNKLQFLPGESVNALFARAKLARQNMAMVEDVPTFTDRQLILSVVNACSNSAKFRTAISTFLPMNPVLTVSMLKGMLREVERLAAQETSSTVLFASGSQASQATNAHLARKVQLLEQQVAAQTDIANAYKAIAHGQSAPAQLGRGRSNASQGVKKVSTKKKVAGACYNCNKLGHQERECRAPCKVCSSTQHTRYACPVKQARRQQDAQHGRSNLVLGSDPGFNDPTAQGNMVAGSGGPLPMPSLFLFPCGDTAGAAPPTGKTPDSHASAHVLSKLTGTSTVASMWILDSGATHHMTPWAELLHDYKPTCHGNVSTAANNVVPRAGLGSLKFHTEINGQVVTRTICDVWHVPALSHSLLSSQQLKRQGCWLISGRKGDPTEYVFDTQDNLVLEAPLADGLCRPNFSVQINTNPYSAPADNPVAPQVGGPDPSVGLGTGKAAYAAPNHVTAQETPDLWHRRLGHISYEALAKMAQDKLVTGMTVTASEFRNYSKTHTCEVCVQAKHRASPFRPRTERSQVAGTVLHSDVCGPYETESLGGGRYVHTLSDEASSFISVNILKLKEHVAERFQFNVEQWEAATKTRVTKIFSDRGGEYIDGALQRYFLSKGITHEFAVPHMKQTNGKAERVNQTLNDTVRAMLIEASMPKMFWAHAMVYAVQVRNATYKHRIGMTPHQAFIGFVPNVKNFRTFGCKVYAKVPDSQRKKLDPKSELGVYLGPETKGPGCKILVHRPTHKYAKYSVAVRRDVVTYEAPSVQGPMIVPGEHEVSLVLPEVTAPGLDDQSHQFTLMDAFVPSTNPHTPYTLRSQAPPSSMQPELAHDSAAPPGPTQQVQSGTIPLSGQAVEPLLPTSTRPRSAQLVRYLPSGQADSAVGGGRDIPTGGSEECNLASGSGRDEGAKRQKLGDDLPYPPRPVITDADKFELPKSVAQARASPYSQYWEEAMLSEINSLNQHNTWELEDRVPGMKVLPCHWVFRIKVDANNKPQKFKARLVAGGNRQVEGLDYGETYAPVSTYATMRILMLLAAHRGWEVKQLDIKTAFLNGDIDTLQYMIQPPGFQNGQAQVCKLLKSLYGLKQAPRQWYLKISELLKSLGFTPHPSDKALWVSKSGDCVVFLCMYVDDIMVTSKDLTLTMSTIKRILDVFEGVLADDCTNYVGMKITWLPEEKAVHLSQPSHIADLVAKHQPHDEVWEPLTLPVKPHLRLHKNGTSDDPKSPPLDTGKHDFRSAVGSFLYLACCTRPDIMWIVIQLAKFSACPTQAHWAIVMALLRYLLGTINWGIKLGHSAGYMDPQGVLHPVLGYCDSEYGTGIDDKRPSAGHVFLLHGGAITWAAQTQRLVSTSTTEAEYRQMATASKDALWLAKMLPLFDVPCKPFLIRGDNQPALAAVQSLAPTRHTKHIEMQLDFMRDRYASGDITFQYVRSEDNCADIFTKALPFPAFAKCRAGLGMCDMPGI